MTRGRLTGGITRGQLQVLRHLHRETWTQAGELMPMERPRLLDVLARGYAERRAVDPPVWRRTGYEYRLTEEGETALRLNAADAQ